MKNVIKIAMIYFFLFSCKDSVLESSDCLNEEVELWGQCYDIASTTELDLSNNNLSGPIPAQLTDLTNLVI